MHHSVQITIARKIKRLLLSEELLKRLKLFNLKGRQHRGAEGLES